MDSRAKLRFILILALVCLSISLSTGKSKGGRQHVIGRRHVRADLVNNPQECNVKLAMALCDEETVSIGNNFDRQINQTLVLIKSILITMSGGACVRVILISNKKPHFDRIRTEIFENPQKWDVRYTARLELEFVAATYPAGAEWMRGLYRHRPCSSIRLFLPDILPHYDSVIFSDTDVIYLQSIQQLWSKLKHFNPSALVGLVTRPVNHGGIFMPCYGQTGISTGVMLANLTRMRTTKWTQQVLSVSQPYFARNKIRHAEEVNFDTLYYNDITKFLSVAIGQEWKFLN